jgi:hypothetical protein
MNGIAWQISNTHLVMKWYSNICMNACVLSLQSSWTKRAVEVDSPKPMSPWDQDHLSDPPDSTCAQVIHSRPEACDNSWVPLATTKKCGEQDDELGRHGSVCSDFFWIFTL